MSTVLLPAFRAHAARAQSSSFSEVAVSRRLDRLTSQAASVDGVMMAWPDLCSLLTSLYQIAERHDWTALVRSHPVAQLAWNDPFTAWSYQKPRGYPGDPRLIDFAYGHPSVQKYLDEATPVGRDVYLFLSGSQAVVAVRERRHLLARLIDDAVERLDSPDVLAIAPGHLREVEYARRAREIRRFVAFDQYKESLDELRSSHAQLRNIETIEAGFSSLLLNPERYGHFDFIYTAGLYDYLNLRTATRLTGALFRALKPGGRLLFANFSTGINECGYLSMMMDWPLVLRGEAEMRAMLDNVLPDELERVSVFRGNNNAIIYVLLVRR
jgi:SAM-dependent methyltransferase